MGLGFGNDTAKGFGVGGGGNDDVGEHVGGRHVIALAGELDDAIQAVIGDALFELPVIAGAALIGADEAGSGDPNGLVLPGRR